MARSHDEVQKMIADAAANPVGARLLELIFAANTGEELNRICSRDIPEAEGISEPEREALQEAVNLRFCALNSAAMPRRDKARWDF
jgi:hypothetical protein